MCLEIRSYQGLRRWAARERKALSQNKSGSVAQRNVLLFWRVDFIDTLKYIRFFSKDVSFVLSPFLIILSVWFKNKSYGIAFSYQARPARFHKKTRRPPLPKRNGLHATRHILSLIFFYFNRRTEQNVQFCQASGKNYNLLWYLLCWNRIFYGFIIRCILEICQQFFKNFP